jgi:hypothetical protein
MTTVTRTATAQPAPRRFIVRRYVGDTQIDEPIIVEARGPHYAARKHVSATSDCYLTMSDRRDDDLTPGAIRWTLTERDTSHPAGGVTVTELGEQLPAVMHVSVEFRRRETRRHRPRYVVHYQGRSVSVVPDKGWSHAEAYIRAAAQATGLPPEAFGTDCGFYRSVGWRWFTTDPRACKDDALDRRGFGAPRP